MRAHKTGLSILVVGVVALVAACGGGGGGSSSTPTTPTLSSITVTPESSSIAAGTTTQFVATGTYSNGTMTVITSTVSWTSATTSTATISPAGLATGVATGTSAITASLGGVTSTPVTLTVTAATVKSIAVTPPSPSVMAGATSQLTATGTYTDGTTTVLSSGVTWTSATTTVATINASGLVTGVAAGSSAITAAAGGITSTAISLTVTPPALVSISITPATPAHILVNGGITQFTATGTYGNDTTAVITSSVTWSSATSSTATIAATSGLATLATPAPAVGAATVITASLGAITSNPVTLTVSPAEFALVTNFSDATVSQYYVAGNGVLTPLTPASVTTTPLTGAAVSTVWPYTVVVDPTASFAYVANYGANGESIAQFTINKTTGALTANGPNIATGHGPNGLAIFPTASTANPSPSPYLYSVNISEDDAPYSDAISEFIYSSTGMLSNNTAAPFVAVTPPAGSTAAPSPASIAIVAGASGAYAYVADYTNPGSSSYVSEFSVGTNGVLTPLSTPTVAAGNQPNNIVSPNGVNVYAVNNSAGTVSQYAIGAGGQLAPLSVATVAASAGAESIAFNPAGSYAYVANCPLTNGKVVNNGSISEYSVGTSGALTLIGTETVNVGLCPSFITVDPSGQFLYVTNRGAIQAAAAPYGTTVSEFSVGANGSLTPLGTPTVATGNQPTGIIVFSE